MFQKTLLLLLLALTILAMFYAYTLYWDSHSENVQIPKNLILQSFAGSERSNNLSLLSRTINGEARGEPYVGQVAIAAVILNRTRDARFPKTIAGVIYQPGAFTAVSDGQINVAIDPKSTVIKAAKDALNGWDPTSGCVYYWNPRTATNKWIWSRKIIAVIGKHNFAK